MKGFKEFIVESFAVDPKKHKDLIDSWNDYRYPSGPNRSRMSDLAKKRFYDELKELGVDISDTKKEIAVLQAFDKHIGYIK